MSRRSNYRLYSNQFNVDGQFPFVRWIRFSDAEKDVARRRLRHVYTNGRLAGYQIVEPLSAGCDREIAAELLAAPVNQKDSPSRIRVLRV